MKVTYQAKAYMSKYDTLDGIAAGRCVPMLTTRDGSYFESEGSPLIGTAEVTVTLHSADEVVQNQISALQAQLQKQRAEAYRAEQAILERISKLQAITYEPAAA